MKTLKIPFYEYETFTSCQKCQSLYKISESRILKVMVK